MNGDVMAEPVEDVGNFADPDEMPLVAGEESVVFDATEAAN